MSKAQTPGYSGKPLYAKLGFKPGMRVRLFGAPKAYSEWIAGAEHVTFTTDGDQLDAIHLFLLEPGDIAGRAAEAIDLLREGGMLWVSWTKKSSKLFSGVTEDDLRASILPLGWVDVKVCAVSADWSGLKFLKRKV